MWPGCWHRWQRTCPLLRRLLGQLPFLCRLSSRRSRLLDIFSCRSKMSFISESCVAPGAKSTAGVGVIGLPVHSKWPMVLLTPCIFAQTTSISGTAEWNSNIKPCSLKLRKGSTGETTTHKRKFTNSQQRAIGKPQRLVRLAYETQQAVTRNNSRSCLSVSWSPTGAASGANARYGVYLV